MAGQTGESVMPTTSPTDTVTITGTDLRAANQTISFVGYDTSTQQATVLGSFPVAADGSYSTALTLSDAAYSQYQFFGYEDNWGDINTAAPGTTSYMNPADNVTVSAVYNPGNHINNGGGSMHPGSVNDGGGSLHPGSGGQGNLGNLG
jgi:hypothetical protein